MGLENFFILMGAVDLLKKLQVKLESYEEQGDREGAKRVMENFIDDIGKKAQAGDKVAQTALFAIMREATTQQIREITESQPEHTDGTPGHDFFK